MGWVIIYCQLMHINTKHQLTAGQSKLAKGYFFWHTRLDAKIQFSSYVDFKSHLLTHDPNAGKMALKMHICTCTGKGEKCLHHVQLHCRKYSSFVH